MKKIINIILVCFFGSYIFYLFYNENRFDTIQKSFKITTAKILEVNVFLTGKNSRHGDYEIIYEYYVNGERYSNYLPKGRLLGDVNRDFNFCEGDTLTVKKIKLLLQNKSFPLAYSLKHNEDCRILIKKQYADLFHFTIPDSLKHYDSVLSCK